MAELVTNSIRRLFEVRLLHHYWLDEGATVFDEIAEPAKQQVRLLGYDARALFTVRPTPSTARAIAGFGGVFRSTSLGLIVGAPAGSAIAPDTKLSFVVAPRDGQVLDYTALTLRRQRIYEAFDPTDNAPGRQTYQYKENVPLLSNLTGARRGADLYLSRDYPPRAGGDPVEALVQAGGALHQLTSDEPGAATQLIATAATDMPVFVNQADPPPIVAPAGVVGAPARGVLLTDDVADDVFALISLTAVRADDTAFSFVDGAGAPKATPPVYQVRFKSRSTYWTYRDKQTGAVKSTEPNPLPLTFFGKFGSLQKPSRGGIKVELSGSRVTRIVSEIYV